MMLPLSKVSYGGEILLNLEKTPTKVLPATSEPNFLKFGSSNKGLFDQLAEFLGQVDPTIDCAITDGVGTCTSASTCATLAPQMHNMTIQIEKVAYTIPAESFAETSDSTCKVLIEYNESLGDMIYVGLPFFENFVAAYEYTKGRVKFGLNVNAYEGAAIDATSPWDDLVKAISGLSGWEIFGLVVGVIAIILLLVFCCFCLLKSLGQRQDEGNAKKVLYAHEPLSSGEDLS